MHSRRRHRHPTELGGAERVQHGGNRIVSACRHTITGGNDEIRTDELVADGLRETFPVVSQALDSPRVESTGMHGSRDGTGSDVQIGDGLVAVAVAGTDDDDPRTWSGQHPVDSSTGEQRRQTDVKDLTVLHERLTAEVVAAGEGAAVPAAYWLGQDDLTVLHVILADDGVRTTGKLLTSLDRHHGATNDGNGRAPVQLQSELVGASGRFRGRGREGISIETGHRAPWHVDRGRDVLAHGKSERIGDAHPERLEWWDQRQQIIAVRLDRASSLVVASGGLRKCLDGFHRLLGRFNSFPTEQRHA